MLNAIVIPFPEAALRSAVPTFSAIPDMPELAVQAETDLRESLPTITAAVLACGMDELSLRDEVRGHIIRNGTAADYRDMVAEYQLLAVLLGQLSQVAQEAHRRGVIVLRRFDVEVPALEGC